MTAQGGEHGMLLIVFLLIFEDLDTNQRLDLVDPFRGLLI